jgi:hypothetical protein
VEKMHLTRLFDDDNLLKFEVKYMKDILYVNNYHFFVSAAAQTKYATFYGGRGLRKFS